MSVRKAMFAGSWYPSGADACEKEIAAFVEEGDQWQVPGDGFVGGIVPHAGWYFSGAIACNVIRLLREEPPPDALLVFGMHLGPGAPNYIMTEGACETPFGDLAIQTDIAAGLVERFSFQIETTERFTPDNTIELQLPFIKYFFPDVAIVPMGMPPENASLEIGRAAVEISTQLGLKVKVVGSTDLTHYGVNYGFMPQGSGSAAVAWVRNENDRRVINAMAAMDPAAVLREAAESHNACCAGAAATAIAAGKALGAEKGTTVTYATSYDKSPGDSLVGYVGMVF